MIFQIFLQVEAMDVEDSLAKLVVGQGPSVVYLDIDSQKSVH
jgi:hypothetical protein